MWAHWDVGPYASPPVGRDKSGPYAHSVQNFETHPSYRPISFLKIASHQFVAEYHVEIQ